MSPSSTRTRIRATAIELSEVVERVQHVEAGAIATFSGVVRATNHQRAVTMLEYQAYESMAELEMAKILDELRETFPLLGAEALHRTGALRVGEIAVVCAVSSPHRREAFDACHKLIDEIKARVPIWKREHGPQGPYWVGFEDARCVHS